jgi:hypothetical protein
MKRVNEGNKRANEEMRRANQLMGQQIEGEGE